MDSAAVPPISSRSLPALLSLPVEIRLKILFYALQGHEGAPLNLPRGYIVRFSWIPCSRGVIRGQLYWGTEQMSRPLRINRQIHIEAEEVLYGKFIMQWPLSFCTCKFPIFLSQRSARVPHLVKTICISYVQFIRGPESAHLTTRCKARDLYEKLQAGLPALQRVILLVDFSGLPVESQAEKAKQIDMIVKLAGVFRDVEALELWNSDNPRYPQMAEIVRAARERVAMRDWGERDVPGPGFMCCEERRKILEPFMKWDMLLKR